MNVKLSERVSEMRDDMNDDKEKDISIYKINE